MRIVTAVKSIDGMAQKIVQKTVDGYFVESAYVDYPNKHIICFSTQIGCRCGCKFCYNGCLNRFIRDLEADEIYRQVENMIYHLNPIPNKPILFSAMGVGEPLCNYTNLITAMHILHNAYPSAKFAIATIGTPCERIYNLIDDTSRLNFKLTISLHSAIENDRKWLMPASGDLQLLLGAVETYQKQTGREVEYNIVLIDGINDSPKHAEAVYRLLYSRGLSQKAIIKINKLNPVSLCKLTESKRIDEFCHILRSYGVNVERYETNGSDIGAACGQLLGGKYSIGCGLSQSNDFCAFIDKLNAVGYVYPATNEEIKSAIKEGI